MASTAPTDGRLTHTNGTLNFSPTLSSMESHRVVAVMEKALERLQLLTMLNYETAMDAISAGDAEAQQGKKSSTKKKMDASAENLQKGVGNILEEQKKLESRYEALLIATKKVHNNPLDPSLDTACFAHVDNPQERALLEELQEVSLQLKTHSKVLCRQLKENPNDADNWRKVVHERSDLITLLSACARELSTAGAVSEGAAASVGSGDSASATYEVFAKKILDEQSAAIWARDLVRKEKETNQSVKQLQNDVRTERALKEQELEERHLRIAALKAELRMLKREVKEKVEKMSAETEAASEAQQRKALEEQRLVREDMDSTLTSTSSEKEVNGLLRNHIEGRIKELDVKAQEFTKKANVAQVEKQNEKADVETQRQKAAEALRDKTEARIMALEARKHREEDRKTKDQDQGDRERRHRSEYSSATKLQAALKGFFTRQALVTLKKKAGKKKK